MNITKGLVRAWSRLGQRAAFFGVAMHEIARENDNLMVVTADLAQLSNLIKFKEQFPDKFLNVGIAEQNMIGVSAGLAMEGYNVYATTYASFIAVRDLEHVRQHLSNLGLSVKLIGTAAGVVAARSGVAHWASEDMTFMRVLPGMTVMSAADSLEAYQMAMYSVEHKGPLYIRLNGAPNCPIVYDENYKFEPEKISIVKEGSVAALISSGLMVYESLEAARILEENGISCTVANMHTIKPIDREGLKKLFDSHQLIVTVEEHSIIGGMGSAVAEYKATLDNTPRQVFIGFRDSFYKSGSQRYIWEEAGLTAEKIAEKVRSEIGI
ncbi:MAG: transketolase [Lachnospiraceae bacterium]|nr:transketolase [Lachnospiraceae bacterium]